MISGSENFLGRGSKWLFLKFEANFLKSVHPYGSKNIFPHSFPPKGLWVQKIFKKSNSITLIQTRIQEKGVLISFFQMDRNEGFLGNLPKSIGNHCVKPSDFFFVFLHLWPAFNNIFALANAVLCTAAPNRGIRSVSSTSLINV